jgi:hypothetical protein
MKLDLLPLLQIQRSLYDIPRGWTRFQAYLDTMIGGSDDIVLPLVGMNPMGKEHVAVMLDALIAFDAEAIASAALVEATQRLAGAPGQLQVALVATDDAQGGWTNRYFTEMQLRFDSTRLLARGWAVVPIWTSETWSVAKVREEVLATAYRSAYLQQYGVPKTLQQMLTQEGLVAVFAGAGQPTLDPDDLDYTREVMRPYRDSTHYPTIFTCLYGDEAARSVGYPALGLSPHAGYALARAEAQHKEVT